MIKITKLKHKMTLLQISRDLTDKDVKLLKVFNIRANGSKFYPALLQGTREVAYYHYSFKSDILILPSGRAQYVCRDWAKTLKREFGK